MVENALYLQLFEGVPDSLRFRLPILIIMIDFLVFMIKHCSNICHFGCGFLFIFMWCLGNTWAINKHCYEALFLKKTVHRRRIIQHLMLKWKVNVFRLKLHLSLFISFFYYSVMFRLNLLMIFSLQKTVS